MFPVVQRWPFFEPSMAKPPSALVNRLIHRSHAFAIRGFSLVSPRSDKMRSIQLVERYLGRERASSPAHHPPGSCVARISAAHPVFAIDLRAAMTSASSSILPASRLRVKYRTAGWFSSSNQSRTLFALVALVPRHPYSAAISRFL